MGYEVATRDAAREHDDVPVGNHGPKRAKKGREVLVVGNVVLQDREYDEDTLPYEGYQFHELSGVDGQGLAEYALILALIAVIAIAALVFLGTRISEILSSIGANI